MGLPLLRVPKTLTPAVIVKEIYTAKNRHIINGYQRGLKFLQLILDEKGISEIAIFLSEHIHLPVRIFDEYFNMLAYHGFKEKLDLLDTKNIRLEYENLKKNNILEKKVPYYVADNFIEQVPGQIIYPIKVTSKCHGYISIITNDDSVLFDQGIASYLGTAALICAIELLKEKAVWEAEEKISGDFLDNLFDGNLQSIKFLQRRAAKLGFDHTKPFTIFIIEIDDFSIMKNLKSSKDMEDLKKSIYAYVKSALFFKKFKAILKYRNEKLCALCQLGKEYNKEELSKMAREIQETVKANLAVTVSVGFGKVHTKLADSPIIYQEAEKALSIGRRLWYEEFVVFYEDLGVYRLFANIESKAELNSYYRNTVQPLIQYDHEYNSEIMKTLETFLDCNGSIKDTAENLFLHRHTLRYRLRKIKDITNLDPQDCQDRFRLQMGIVVSHLLADAHKG